MRDLDTALNSACEWLALHPRITTLLLVVWVYAAFRYAGGPTP